MQTPADDPAREAALNAAKRGFYGGDLPAAVNAGQALLATIDAATLDAIEQSTRARALLRLVRCARRADELDTALAHAYTGAAARAASDSRLECRLQAQYVQVLASLGQNETALDETLQAAAPRGRQRRDAGPGGVLAGAGPGVLGDATVARRRTGLHAGAG